MSKQLVSFMLFLTFLQVSVDSLLSTDLDYSLHWECNILDIINLKAMENDTHPLVLQAVQYRSQSRMYSVHVTLYHLLQPFDGNTLSTYKRIGLLCFCLLLFIMSHDYMKFFTISSQFGSFQFVFHNCLP